jgi:histidine triad (HIT) family protein
MSEAESDCLFCKIRDGKIPADIVHRDAHVLAFKDITPRAPLHLLVIPTRHIAGLPEAAPQDAEVFGRLLLAGARLAKEAGFGESGYRAVMNAGPDAGQSVLHAHLHVLGGRPLAWPPG